MYTNPKLVIVGAAIAGFTAHNYLKVVRQERAKRAEIKQEALAQITAIYAARDEILLKIADGTYDGNLSTLNDDIKFYTMINREK